MKYLTPLAFMADGVKKGLISIVERSPIILDFTDGVPSQMNSEFVMETVKFGPFEISYIIVASSFA